MQTPQLPMKANGSGDVTAALFTAHLLQTGMPAVALGAHRLQRVRPARPTPSSPGERELQLVQSQDAIAHPRMQFEVQQVR